MQELFQIVRSNSQEIAEMDDLLQEEGKTADEINDALRKLKAARSILQKFDQEIKELDNIESEQLEEDEGLEELVEQYENRKKKAQMQNKEDQKIFQRLNSEENEDEKIAQKLKQIKQERNEVKQHIEAEIERLQQEREEMGEEAGEIKRFLQDINKEDQVIERARQQANPEENTKVYRKLTQFEESLETLIEEGQQVEEKLQKSIQAS
jgi:hypothetical protein